MAIKGKQAVGQVGVTLIVQDVASAADFYRDVLGAEEVQRNFSFGPNTPFRIRGAFRRTQTGRRISHRSGAESPAGAKRHGRIGRAPLLSAGAASVFLTIYVDDVDAVFEGAIAAGATPQVKDQFPESTYWGDRIAQIHDPFGHVWRIQTRIEDVADDELAAQFTTQQDRARAVRAKAPN